MKRFDETVKNLVKENDLALMNEAVSPAQSVFTFKPQYSTTTSTPITIIPKQFPRDSEIYRETYQLYQEFCKLSEQVRSALTSKFFNRLSASDKKNLQTLFDDSANLREQITSFVMMIMYGKKA